jgi:hypothetical protein
MNSDCLSALAQFADRLRLRAETGPKLKFLCKIAARFLERSLVSVVAY